jgi:hypothetical protein
VAYAFGVPLEPRTTKDIDLWIRNDPENARADFHALAEFGAPIEGLSPADFTDGTIFQMGEPRRESTFCNWFRTRHGNTGLKA